MGNRIFDNQKDLGDTLNIFFALVAKVPVSSIEEIKKFVEQKGGKIVYQTVNSEYLFITREKPQPHAEPLGEQEQ